MSKLITHIKRLALALCLATPIVSWAAVDYTGTVYEPWSYSAGCVVWRATSGQLFHASTVADVAADGTIGANYNLNTQGHPWNVFASTVNGQANANYTSPGLTLVFDEAGYNASSDAQFAPLSLGGMWVKALQAENTPYCITDNKTDGSNRQVELGATGASTYFKFDESFTFNRNTATAVKGTATVEIAADKTFSINQRAGKGAVVESGNTLILKGEGTLAVVGGLTISGTLDLSAATRPTIDGDVALAGTIVLPEGTEVSESPFTVCSGTLSGVNVSVKIGDAEAVEKSFTAENGAITSFGDPIYIFNDNYPTVVPAGQTYTFVGGDSAENTVVVDALDVKGTLKTQGYFSFTNYKSNGSTLDVESGSLTLSPGNNWFNGTLTVEAGATFVNGMTDAVQYGGTFTANVYGTLDMGATRWSLGSNNTLNFYEGCTVTGSGQSDNGTFDWIENATATMNVYGDVNLAAPIRIRSTGKLNVNVDTTDQKGLTLAGTIGGGTLVKKGAGLVKFTTNPPYAITVENGAFTFAVDATPTITYSAKPGAGTTMSMWYATQATWKGTVVIGTLSAPTALPLNTYGNANSKIVLTGTTGNCYLNGTTTIAAEVVVGTDENSVVEFNNGNSNQVGTFSKVSGPGTLKLVGWTGCSAATYVLSTLDNFEGLAIANNITRDGGGTFTVRIGNIVTTRTTNPGDCVLPIANTALDNATGTVVYDLANAQVNGNTLDLEAKDDGIYVVVPTVTVTVPEVPNTLVTVEVGGVKIGDTVGNYDVAPGSVVTVTYAAADGYKISGTTVYTINTANSETTFTPSAQVALIVAYIGETPYTDLATAFSAVDDEETLTLVGTAVTLSSDVTVAKSYTLAGDAEGTTVTGAGKIYLTGSAELTLDATVTVGNQFVFQSADAELTFPSDKTPASVRPLSNYTAGTRDNADGTKTYYMYRFLMLSVGGSNVNLAYADGTTINDETVESGTAVVAQQIYEGDTLVFTATPAEGYENVVVTVNGDTQTLVDGKYTVVVGTVNVVIQATASIKQVTLTLPEVANATAAVTVDSVAQTAPYTFDYGTEVTVTWTAADNYEITEGAVENITLTADTEAAAPTVVVTKYTVTVPIVEHTAITVTEGGVTVDGAEDGEGNMVYLVTPASKVVVKYTAVGAYVGSKTKTITSISENTVISGSDVPVPVAAEVEFTNSKSVVSYMLATSLGSLNEGTYKLLTDASRTQRMAFGTWADSVTIDLNGYTLTSTASDCAITAGRTGSATMPKVLNLVDTSAEKGGKLLFTTSPSSTTAAISVGGKYNQVTIGEGVTVDGGAVAMLGENQTLTVNGTVNGGSDFAIVSNGSASKDLTLTVAAGAVVTSDVTAIYLPGTGTATIAGSVTGKTGIEVRSGSLTVVDGATITATGAFSEVKNGSGTTVDGAAVAVSQHTTKNAIDVTVSGGTLTGAKSLYETNIQNGEDTVDITMSVTGGTFNGAVASADVTGFITGGTFDSDPSNFVAFGYKATETAGTWTVAKQPTTPPETPQVIDVDTTKTPEQQQADADAIAQDTVVTTPNADVAAAVSAETYDSYFTKTAVKVNEQWTVQTELNEEVVFPASATTVEEETITQAEELLEAATDTKATEATVPAVPGIYYSMEAANNLGFAEAEEGEQTLATGSAVTIKKPTQVPTGNAVFFRVKASATPKANN